MKKSDIITGILAQDSNTKTVEELEALTKSQLEELLEGKPAPVKDDRPKKIDVKVNDQYRKATLISGKYYIKVRGRRYEVSEAGELLADFEGNSVTVEDVFPKVEKQERKIDVTVNGITRRARLNKGKYWVRLSGIKYAVTPEGEVYENEAGEKVTNEDIEIPTKSKKIVEKIDVIVGGQTRRAKVINGVTWIRVKKVSYKVENGEVVEDADGNPVKTEDIIKAGSTRSITVNIDGVEHKARKSKKGHYVVTIRHYFNEAGEAIELDEEDAEAEA